MLKIAPSLLTAIWKKSVNTIFLCNLSAALISLTAHFLLILFLDAQIVRTRAMQSGKDSSENVITINLVTPETRNRESAAIETQIQSIGNLSPSVALPDLPPPAVDIVLPPEPHYFSAGELTEKPRVLVDIPSDLAAELNNRTPHAAVFRLQINEQGKIDQVIVDASEFPESEQKLLVEAFSRMKFEPGKIADIPVKSEMKIEILTEKVPSETPVPPKKLRAKPR